jgi:hypothetical protein
MVTEERLHEQQLPENDPQDEMVELEDAMVLDADFLASEPVMQEQPEEDVAVVDEFNISIDHDISPGSPDADAVEVTTFFNCSILAL